MASSLLTLLDEEEQERKTAPLRAARVEDHRERQAEADIEDRPDGAEDPARRGDRGQVEVPQHRGSDEHPGDEEQAGRGEAVVDHVERRTGATDRGNHEAAVKMVKMQGGVFGAVARSTDLLRVLA